MTSFPNSTNKRHTLILKEIIYPGDDFTSYYLTAQEVEQVYSRELLPFISIEGLEEKGPKVAIILAQAKHPARDKKDYMIHLDYVSAIVEAGGYPLFVAYDKVCEQLDAMQPDAVLLIGGNFNTPKSWYHNPPPEDVDKRGMAYIEMLEYARKHQLPTLGICGGHQVIAGCCGAKLQKGINDNQPSEKSHKQSFYELTHNVCIEEDSRLFEILGKKELCVNSVHNEAVCADDIGDCKIIALAEDGVVEAIELKNPWNSFVLGVQWHPERLLKLGDKDSLKIFNAFIEATQND